MKKSNRTPRSKIRSALRLLSLRCRERAEAIKRDKYTCQMCGRKKSTVKGHEVHIEGHHINGIVNWDKVIDMILDEILVPSDQWTTLCDECHKNIHS